MAGSSGGNRMQMGFWDGMDSVYTRHSLTPTGTGRSIPVPSAGFCPHILGSFDVVQTETLVGNKTVILQRPVFHLARNIGEGQNLENKDDLAGDKKLEPLKYAQVAMEASVSRRKVESCILGTTSLLHHCLENGTSVAFVLNDVGVLLIKGSKVQMRFYLDFLEKVMGHRIQDRATLKALQQLDMVVSRQAPITSLSCAGRVVVFPSKLPVMPGAAAGGKQPEPDQAKGKPVPKGQASKQSDKEAVQNQGSRGGRGERRDEREREGEKKVQPGKEGEKRETLRGEEKARLGRNGEKVQLRKEGETRETLGREEERRDSLREGERRDSSRREGESRDSLRQEGEKVLRGKEAKDAVGSEGEKKAHPKRGENKVSPSRKGEKKVPLGKGEKKILLGRVKKFCLNREDMNYLLGREREKRLVCGVEEERKARAGSPAVPWGGQARKPQDCKVFILQQRGAEAAQGLRARPEAFWSVLKEPQKSVLAGYRFESSCLLPPLSLQDMLPMLKKREMVSRGPWPWVE